MEHKEITKERKTWKLGVHSMKESSKKALEMLMSNKMTKYLELYQTFRWSLRNHSYQNPLEKRSVCVTCDQTLALKNGCKNTYRGRKHWALAKFLDEMFSNRKEVDNCIYKACEPIPRECT